MDYSERARDCVWVISMPFVVQILTLKSSQHYNHCFVDMREWYQHSPLLHRGLIDGVPLVVDYHAKQADLDCTVFDDYEVYVSPHVLMYLIWSLPWFRDCSVRKCVYGNVSVHVSRPLLLRCLNRKTLLRLNARKTLRAKSDHSYEMNGERRMPVLVDARLSRGPLFVSDVFYIHRFSISADRISCYRCSREVMKSTKYRRECKSMLRRPFNTMTVRWSTARSMIANQPCRSRRSKNNQVSSTSKYDALWCGFQLHW